MPSDAAVHLTQSAYRALLTHIEDLEDRVAALEADDGSRIPHPVALAIIRGDSPIVAFRTHHVLTLRELARRAGISPSYLSEIERRRKPGSAATLAKIAATLETTIDTLLTNADTR
ncbi:MAG: helix-turn-helix transcriptional regulator [Chloroflexota bacterium]|nr:helix-turn-helix transcriptional regulator [Chloroflexota bacterium]